MNPLFQLGIITHGKNIPPLSMFHFLELGFFAYLKPAVAEVYSPSLPKDYYEQRKRIDKILPILQEPSKKKLLTTSVATSMNSCRLILTCTETTLLPICTRFHCKKSSVLDDKEKNREAIGRHYTYETARKYLPMGWRIPTIEDWDSLINFTKENYG